MNGTATFPPSESLAGFPVNTSLGENTTRGPYGFIIGITLRRFQCFFNGRGRTYRAGLNPRTVFRTCGFSLRMVIR